MRRARARRAGAPLIALALAVGGWIALRGLSWTAIGLPLEDVSVATAQAHWQPITHTRQAIPRTTVKTAGKERTAWQVYGPSRVGSHQPQRSFAKPRVSKAGEARHAAQTGSLSHFTFPADALAIGARQAAANTARPAADALPSIVNNNSSTRRLSADAWLFLRHGQQNSVAPLRPGTLGASQAGAVIRYDLRLGNQLPTEAYLRASKALVEQGESEAAAGLAMRPLPEVPVAFQAEARVSQRHGKASVRPAAFVTAGLQRELAGVTVRGYAQAGYVGGPSGTAFADGQLVAEERTAQVGPVRLHVGTGIWAGAQTGAARVDVGPTASAEMRVTGASVRIEASLRYRIAGDAQPDNGFALAVSTGF